MAIIVMNDAPERSSIEAVVNQLNFLIADVASIRTKFNAHTHVENTAGAYAQNASTATIVVGQQAPVATCDTITLKK
jgi:hypothetical protein